MPKYKYRFQMYRHLGSRARDILAEADNASKELGPPEKPVPRGQSGSRLRTVSSTESSQRIREIVKDFWGDDYDACPFGSAEGAMRSACRNSLAPQSWGAVPGLGARYIMPWEKQASRLASYGSVHPPKYRGVFATGQDTSQWQLQGSLAGLSSVVIPLHGAIYANHGIAFVQTPFLTRMDPESSLQIIAAAAETNAANLAGFVSLGYNTPGHSGKTEGQNGVSLLRLGLSQIAAEFNVPYVVDARDSFPFLEDAKNPAKAGATIFRLWARGGIRSPALLVGYEELIAPIRKQAGLHMPPPSFGYAYEGSPLGSLIPEPETVAHQAGLLEFLQERPRHCFDAVDDLHKLVQKELEECPGPIRKSLCVSKSYGMMRVEVNYEDSWLEGAGLPVFTEADTRAGTNLLRLGLDLMGATGIQVEDASIYLDAWNICSREPNLDEQKARHATRCLTRLLMILGRYSGFLDS